MTKLLIPCTCCNKQTTLFVDVENLVKWENNEMYAQEAFSHLTPGERELIISNTCETCFEEMFK